MSAAGWHKDAPDGVDWFAIDRQSTGIVDEMTSTECFWHMGCRNDKSLLLKILIGTDLVMCHLVLRMPISMNSPAIQ